MRDADPSTNEREFLLAALKDGARIDGRKFYDFRTLRLTFGAEYGAVEVQLGNTRSAPLSSLSTSLNHEAKGKEDGSRYWQQDLTFYFLLRDLTKQSTRKGVMRGDQTLYRQAHRGFPYVQH